MIRINLLGVERTKTRKAPMFSGAAQYLTVGCSLILVAAASGIGWWYWTLRQTSTQVDNDIAAARQQQAQLQSVLAEVGQFETRRTQLQQRVQLIEQLRAGQSFPVQLLDHVSRSVPELLWLTQMDQKGEALTIQGRSNTLIALADFVANLGNSQLLQKPIDVDAQVEAMQPLPGQPALELNKFTVRASVKKTTTVAQGPGRGAAAPAVGGSGRGAAAR